MSLENECDEQGVGPRPKVRGSKLRLTVAVAICLLLAAYLALVWKSGRWNFFSSGPHLALSFEGDTAKLTNTQIVPTLDTPVEKGKNVVWCATFVAGWKQLQEKVVHGPVSLTERVEVCSRLNAAPDPADSMPPEAFYANAGKENEGILKTIEQDMKKRFPNHRVHRFEAILPGSFVMYSYLQVRVPFAIPYFDSRKPLEFTDSRGNKQQIHSFGVREEDADRYSRLRHQMRLLMSKSEENTRNDYGYERPEEFAFDLCSESAPCQIVVACVELKETLAATLDALDQDIAASQDRDRAVALGGSDVLLVPDMFWRFEHRFRELERLRFENKDLTGQSISVAAQDIQFRLDKSGAELWSEAWQNWESAGPQHYVLDRPFLVYLKKRDAPTPFFVMWIDNAELLQPWSN